MDINELRRKNLRLLAEEVGGVSKLADLVNKDPSQVSQWINGYIIPTTGKPRGVRSSTLREVETLTGKPANWLDIDHEAYLNPTPAGYVYLDYYDIQSSAGPGSVVTYEPKIKQLLVLEDWATEYLGRNANRHIKVINNKGVSMHPTINDGDVLLVDITINRYDGDGIYVINVDGDLLTKRLIKDTDGSLRVVSDNTSIGYKDKIIDSKNKDSLVICGKVKRYFALREPV